MVNGGDAIEPLLKVAESLTVRSHSVCEVSYILLNNLFTKAALELDGGVELRVWKAWADLPFPEDGILKSLTMHLSIANLRIQSHPL